MKTKSDRVIDGGRQRCQECGHPRKEHRGGGGCTVPKCPCTGHTQRGSS